MKPTQEQVIAWAREAGISKPWDQEPVKWETLERFAALVAAAEREKVAQWMIQRSYATGHGDTTEDLLAELEWQVREAEREACIRDCDSVDLAGADDCIAAIRARREQ